MMKTMLITLGLVLAVLLPPARGIVPQPLVTYYGQAVDEYGWPYQANADVIVKVGGVEHARFPINGSVAPGINFAVQLLIDDGNAGSTYSARAVMVGETVEFSIEVNGVEQPVIGNASIPPVPAPGAQIRVDLATGTDVDGDGLPDEWEMDLVLNSGGLYSSIFDVTRAGDLVGDGASNGNEFDAGTLAYWDFDVFALSMNQPLHPPGWLRFDVFTVPGKSYQPTGNPLLGVPGSWSPVPHTESIANNTTMTPRIGDGTVTPFFISMTNEPIQNIRLETQ